MGLRRAPGTPRPLRAAEAHPRVRRRLRKRPKEMEAAGQDHVRPERTVHAGRHRQRAEVPGASSDGGDQVFQRGDGGGL